MHKKLLGAAVLVLVVFVTAAVSSDNAPMPTKLEGIINDYSPSTTAPAGPYHLNGPWSLEFNPSGRAQFSASLTMVHSDLWFVQTGADPNSQAARNFHTHHIKVTDGQFQIVNNVIVVTGPASLTSNGNEIFPGSTVRVEITGGNSQPLSNMKLIFAGPATAHFTDQPYHGVAIR